MEKNKDFLGTQPVGKLLFKLAIPTVIAQLINMLYNIVDRIFIGHIPELVLYMFTLYKKDNDIHSGFHTKLSISRHGVSRHFCGREKELDSTCRNVVKSSSFITEK